MKQKIIPFIITIVLGSLLYYVMLPPLNLSDPSFYPFAIFLATIYYVSVQISKFKLNNNIIIKVKSKNSKQWEEMYFVIGFVAVFVLIMFVNLINSPFFNASKYYNRITIQEDGVFEKDVPEVDFNALPLLDKDSSQKLGDRVMGQMPELVSQFSVSNLYTQINYNNEIVRVTPLEYADIIKYFTNRKNGVKGYIIVNSVNGKVELVKLDKGMKYMPSALFNENLKRKLRFTYPTTIFGPEKFEIDEEGNPYWVVPTIKYAGVGLRPEVTGVVVLDPITGKSTKYKVGEVPSWIDQVYPSSLILEQVNDWGKYKLGFWNSIFGQKSVVATTEGYNYLVMKDDVYLYTGITSVVADESNLGFILTNLRTKDTVFYAVSGAEEYSAMASAEGQVQHLNYRATFPLLINLNNTPTYLLSLKDNAGLVKMYALVDVTDYQKVAVSDAKDGIEAVVQKYLGNDDATTDPDTLITKDITISKIKDAIIDGTTYYYIIDTNNNKYKLSIKVSPNTVPFMEVGETFNVSYKELADIYEIVKIND